ncbi:hypothetical protein MBLNU230_g6983t1 [Neophaeotheca triangularis]
MAPRLFITGVTGYIGGDALYQLHTEHGDKLEYAVLVRTQDKADKVKTAYPNVEIVLGGLDDSDLLEEQAAKADIVIHCADASDHEGAARAIGAGMVKGHSASKPGYWLHTGGTGILTYRDSEAGRLGEWDEKEFNDLDGIEELTNLPDSAFHRNVDKIVLDYGTKHGDAVKTVVVCPPTIYGRGRGPVSGRGRQVYELAKLILTAEYTPVIGQGKARWNYVHVYDLTRCFAALTDKALAGDTSPELWGEKGYMFTEAGEHLWTELARHISKTAVEKGLVDSKATKEDSLSKDAAIEQAGFEAVSWGWNSRGRALRARKYLGWEPKERHIFDEVPTILEEEKARLA